MTGPREKLRRVAIASIVSTVGVVLIALFSPRAFLVNDDAGLILHLRTGTATPWVSEVLARALASAYHAWPDVPWFGLYEYALIIVSGAVLLHSCMELVDRRAGFGAVATMIGAIMVGASHMIVAFAFTWTTVAMIALGTALVAFVAHLQLCHANKTRASVWRALVYGLLFVAGFALREAILAAVGVALLPLVVWTFVGFVRSRRFPRLVALVLFIAPFAIVVAVQRRVPPLVAPTHGQEFAEFNAFRGRISGAAAFENLDTRAPELLERAGWSLDEYRDFSNWILADNTEFTTDKVRRLADTGGLPKSMTAADAYGVLRGIATDSAPAVWLFLTVIAGALALAWLDAVDRRRVLWFALGNLVFLAVVPVLMTAVIRFPQRVSISFYAIAAFGMLVFLAGEIFAAPPRSESTSPKRPAAALLLISLCMFFWARNLLEWTHREPFPYHAALRSFAARLKARNGFVMTAAGITEMDPMLADPRGYDALPGGWGTFTAPWFTYIEKFGFHSGSEALHAMVDNPNAYLVSTPWSKDTYEDWIRRRVGNEHVRLALVDTSAGVPAPLRSDLYQVVTTPLVKDSAEWRLLARLYEWETNEGLRGPPPIAESRFRPVPLTAPFSQYAASVLRPATAVITAIDGGFRCATAETPPLVGDCVNAVTPSNALGVSIPVHGMHAVRFDVTLIDSDNITGLYVYADTDTDRSVRWRWELEPAAQRFGFTGTVTLVPGYAGRRFVLDDNTAHEDEIRQLHVILAIKPGTHAGFELRNLRIANP